MQRGVLWGIGRLSRVRPEQVKDAFPYIMPYLDSPDAVVRGLAVWIMGLLGVKEARPPLEQLSDDDAEIEIYLGQGLVKRGVKELAKEALARLTV